MTGYATCGIKRPGCRCAHPGSLLSERIERPIRRFTGNAAPVPRPSQRSHRFFILHFLAWGAILPGGPNLANWNDVRHRIIKASFKLGLVLEMGEVIRFVPKSELERARLIREARAIYESVFPPETPRSEEQDSSE
jgi:hypothetical protein